VVHRTEVLIFNSGAILILLLSYYFEKKKKISFFYSDVALARVETEKKLSLIRAWEENEKTKAENKLVLRSYHLDLKRLTVFSLL
jgi:hypothetical protein